MNEETLKAYSFYCEKQIDGPRTVQLDAIVIAKTLPSAIASFEAQCPEFGVTSVLHIELKDSRVIIAND